MGVVRRGILGLLLAGLLVAALVAAAFAPRAVAQGQVPAAFPIPTPPPELMGATEIIGWGIIVAFAWVAYPLAGLLLYIAALAFAEGDRGIVAQSSAIILLLFAPIYMLIKAGLGGRKK
jgi:hypothetical protein